MVTGSDSQTQAALDCGALVALAQLMITAKESTRKEICWALSNITAGSQAQIAAVIAAGLVPSLLAALRSPDGKVRKEAAWAVSNLTTGGTIDQIRFVIEQGAIPAVVEMLKTPEAKIIQICLDALTNMLAAGDLPDGTNPCCGVLEECGGLDAVEGLQEHENVVVYEKAQAIIERFFSGEEDGLGGEETSAFGLAAPPVSQFTF